MEVDSDVEDKFINFNLVLSLQAVASVKIAIELWKYELHEAMRRKLLNASENYKNYIKLEKRVFERLSHLCSPREVTTYITKFIRPVGLQLLKFIKIDEKVHGFLSFHNSACQVYSFQWTVDGLLDRQKTLKFQLEHGSFEYDVSEVYEVACNYCMVSWIICLWCKLPEDAKTSFRNRTIIGKNDLLVVYWSSILADIHSDVPLSALSDVDAFNSTTNATMLNLNIINGNAIAVKYFWNKLTTAEKNENLIKWINNVVEGGKSEKCKFQSTSDYHDILCFLLTKLSVEQQFKVLKKHYKMILKALFYNWPWQCFLLPTIEVLWDYIDSYAFRDLLRYISREIGKGRNSLKALLKTVWLESSMPLKETFIIFLCSGDDAKVLIDLFHAKDIESILLIVNYANAEQKREILHTCAHLDELCALIYEENFDIVNCFLSIVPDCDRKTFKKAIVREHSEEISYDLICNNNWNAFQKFVNWCCSSSEELEFFKKNSLDNLNILRALVCQGDYGIVNKFIEWCCTSKENIRLMKDKVAFLDISDLIVDFSRSNCGLFQQFVDWCFDSETELIRFKKHLAQYNRMEAIAFHVLISHYNFEFVNEFLSWCLNSEDEINSFIQEFSCSERGLEIFFQFITYCEYEVHNFSNWELVEKLIQWYSPLNKKTISAFKAKVKRTRGRIVVPETYSIFYSSLGYKQAINNLLDHYAVNQKNIPKLVNCS